MINRLIEPTTGTITVDGTDVSTLPAHELRRGIGYVIQQSGLFPHRTVLANVGHRAPPARLGQGRGERPGPASCSTSSGSTPRFADRYPAQLSGGQQQRVGVARALAADPPVLLMDEPFGAVDPIVRAQLQREFAQLQRDLGKTVVFVTHDVDEAIILGDRIAVLEPGGRLAQLATPAELLANPASAFVADFLGGRTVEFDDGVPVGYRIEARFEPGEPGARRRRASRTLAADTVPQGEASLAAAPLWNGRQLAGNWDVIWYYTLQHARYTVLAVGLGFVLALPAGLPGRAPAGDVPGAARRHERDLRHPGAHPVRAAVARGSGTSNDKPIVVAMTLYTLVILVRNIVEGIRAVPGAGAARRRRDGLPAVPPLRRRRAARSPCPGIVAGLRLATVSTVSLISVGARDRPRRPRAHVRRRLPAPDQHRAVGGDGRHDGPGAAARPRHLRRRPARHAVDPARARGAVHEHDPRRHRSG